MYKYMYISICIYHMYIYIYVYVCVFPARSEFANLGLVPTPKKGKWMTRFAAPIAESIWDMKYRLKDGDGTVHDRTVEDTWRRVARALAGNEADPGTWEEKFFTALEDFRFLPAGRITAHNTTAHTQAHASTGNAHSTTQTSTPDTHVRA